VDGHLLLLMGALNLADLIWKEMETVVCFPLNTVTFWLFILVMDWFVC
jgi:hypothetical protein